MDGMLCCLIDVDIMHLILPSMGSVVLSPYPAPAVLLVFHTEDPNCRHRSGRGDGQIKPLISLEWQDCSTQ